MTVRTVAWDISDCVAATNNNDTFGTAVDVAGIVSVQMTMEVKSGEQPGDGAVYSVVGKFVKGTAKFQFADMQGWEILQIITGKAPESSGSPSALTIPFGSDQFPFFALCGKTNLDDGTGELHIFIPKMKLTANFDIGIADNAFVVPEFTCTAIPSHITRGGKRQLFFPVRYPSEVATAIPPTGVPLT